MDKAELENQVVHGHQQERRHDADLDRAVCVSVNRVSEVYVKSKEIDTANSEPIADEFFRKMVHSRSATWQINRKNTDQP